MGIMRKVKRGDTFDENAPIQKSVNVMPTQTFYTPLSAVVYLGTLIFNGSPLGLNDLRSYDFPSELYNLSSPSPSTVKINDAIIYGSHACNGPNTIDQEANSLEENGNPWI